MSYSRRDFLKSAVGASTLVALGGSVPPLLARAAAAAQAKPGDERVLVALQLTGGNDGLNTVVPYRDDAYAAARSTLRLQAGEVLKLPGDLGLHPELPAVRRLLEEGRLSIVQGVGWTGSSRDHEAAMRGWHTARPEDRFCQTGWLGRAVDVLGQHPASDLPAAFVGPIATPFVLNAATADVPALRRPDQWTLRRAPRWTASSSAPGAAEDLLAMVRRQSATAQLKSERLRSVLGGGPSPVEYPDVPLAADLRAVVQLIRADLGIRIFCVELGGGGIGGFDNHANQRENHASLLRQLGDTLAAFVDDLARAKLLDRVVLMTYSEFGRTLTENGRRGTDHGAAAPVFLVGGAIRGGLIGEHPSLADLDQDAPKPHTDFRRIYATLLDGWLGLESEGILGEAFPPMEVF